MTSHIAARTLDCEQIVFRVLCQREDLRNLPDAMSIAAQLAREMAIDLLANCPEDRPRYVTHRSLDAVLAMIQGTAEYMARISIDLVGESDSDLPTAQ